MNGLTRRQLLATSAGVAAAGISSAGLATPGRVVAASADRGSRLRAAAAGADQSMVAYIGRGSTGEVHVMVGERQVVLHDRDLVGRLVNAAS